MLQEQHLCIKMPLEVDYMPKIATNPKTANINVRMLPEVKAEAERVFGYHGLTLPEAVSVFIKHACHVGGFPFELRGAPYTDDESMEALKEAIHLINDPTAKTYNNVKELFAECLGEDSDDD
jgi:DNA-damage-inducible protein J